MNMVLLVGGMAIVTYLPRVLPSLCFDRFELSERMKIFLQLIPYTALTAMVFPAILSIDENRWIGILGGIFAIACSWKKLPTIVVVILTIFFVFLLYAIGL